MSQRRKLMKQISMDMLKREKVPLRIMLLNMDYYDEEAQSYERIIHEKIAEIKMDGDQLLECLRLMEKLGDARMKAQHCAMQAAPYMHARFAHIHHTSEKVEQPKVLPPDDMEKVREEYRRLRAMPFVPPPASEMIDITPGELIDADED